MFGKMIYYDAKAIKEYAAIASGKNQTVPEKHSKEKGIDAQIDVPLVTVGVKNNIVTNYLTTNSLLLECSQFENRYANIKAPDRRLLHLQSGARYF
jgi:hypothetical protein